MTTLSSSGSTSATRAKGQSTHNVAFIEVLLATISTSTDAGEHHDDDEFVYEDFKLDFDSTESNLDIITNDTNDCFFVDITALEPAFKTDSTRLGSTRRLR